MEEIYSLLFERLNDISNMVAKIATYQNSLFISGNAIMNDKDIELQEISSQINQLKKAERLRIIKENDLIEVIFSLRNFDLQQRQQSLFNQAFVDKKKSYYERRFQIKSMEVMKKINPEFTYEKLKDSTTMTTDAAVNGTDNSTNIRTIADIEPDGLVNASNIIPISTNTITNMDISGDIKDISKQFLKFFLSLKMISKAEDLKRVYTNNKFINYPIMSILMKWLVEISRKQYQSILKDKHSEINSFINQYQKSRPKSTQNNRTSSTLEHNKGGYIRFNNTINSINPGIGIGHNNYQMNQVINRLNHEYYATSLFQIKDNKNDNDNDNDNDHEHDINNFNINEGIPISTASATSSVNKLSLNNNNNNNGLKKGMQQSLLLPLSSPQRNINNKLLRYGTSDLLQMKPQSNVIQIFMSNATNINGINSYNNGGFNGSINNGANTSNIYTDLLDDLDQTHITTVYQVLNFYKNVKKNENGTIITIDLDKKKEMVINIYRNLYHRNIDIEKTINYYKHKYYQNSNNLHIKDNNANLKMNHNNMKSPVGDVRTINNGIRITTNSNGARNINSSSVRTSNAAMRNTGIYYISNNATTKNKISSESPLNNGSNIIVMNGESYIDGYQVDFAKKFPHMLLYSNNLIKDKVYGNNKDEPHNTSLRKAHNISKNKLILNNNSSINENQSKSILSHKKSKQNIGSNISITEDMKESTENNDNHQKSDRSLKFNYVLLDQKTYSNHNQFRIVNKRSTKTRLGFENKKTIDNMQKAPACKSNFLNQRSIYNTKELIAKILDENNITGMLTPTFEFSKRSISASKRYNTTKNSTYTENKILFSGKATKMIKSIDNSSLNQRMNNRKQSDVKNDNKNEFDSTNIPVQVLDNANSPKIGKKSLKAKFIFRDLKIELPYEMDDNKQKDDNSSDRYLSLGNKDYKTISTTSRKSNKSSKSPFNINSFDEKNIKEISNYEDENVIS